MEEPRIRLFHSSISTDELGGSLEGIKVEELAEEFEDFKEKLSHIFLKSTDDELPFYLDEIKVIAEVSADGKLGILGSGLKVGTKAGLTFTFKRNK